MSLTITQKKYLIKRIDEVANQKASQLKDPESIKNREICQEGIKEGKVTLRTRKDIEKIVESTLSNPSYGGWDNTNIGSVNLSDLLIGWEDYLKDRQLSEAKVNQIIVERRNAIYKEATKIKDQAMFGTEQEAYAMLDKFMEMEV